ncbi:MAG: hypothetical protein IT372_14885 [Polyangiaceae bacterium]|nr:hypothetical protein [Polyangiaceae bacterium]
MMLLAPEEWDIDRADDVEDAFRDPEIPLLLTTEDEAGAVEVLNGRRDQLEERSAPVILFLLKGGSGARALREAEGLESWVRGQQYDPESAEIDVDQERNDFKAATCLPPEEWLAAWRHGRIPDTLKNNFAYQRALLLTSRGDST